MLEWQLGLRACWRHFIVKSSGAYAGTSMLRWYGVEAQHTFRANNVGPSLYTWPPREHRVFYGSSLTWCKLRNYERTRRPRARTQGLKIVLKAISAFFLPFNFSTASSDRPPQDPVRIHTTRTHSRSSSSSSYITYYSVP